MREPRTAAYCDNPRYEAIIATDTAANACSETDRVRSLNRTQLKIKPQTAAGPKEDANAGTSLIVAV